MESKHIGIAIGVGICAVMSASSAHADVTEKVTKASKNRHARMAVELAGIFVAGDRWYWRDGGAPNVVDWQLPFDASALSTKATSTGGWRFDGNPYDINALGHPGFGMLTHFLARENRYSVAQSFLISTVASTSWELFVEWAEYGSVNDMLMTSTAGVPLGETAYQMLHHADETDFTFRAGAGTGGATPYGVAGVSGDLELAPKTFAFDAQLEVDDGIRSIDGSATTDLAARERGDVRGAVATRFDYQKHEEREDRAWDYKTTFGIGSTVDVAVRRGDVEVEVGADAYLDVGMSRGQAYDAWRAMHPTEVLRNSMQDKERPYYYGFGASVEPRVDVSFRGVKLGGSVTGAVFSSLEGQDRDQEMITVDPSFTDTDARAHAYVGVERGAYSVKLDGNAFRRGGSADEATDSTTGKSAMVTVAFRR